MITTEQTLMKIAAKAWNGEANSHLCTVEKSNFEALANNFREIQVLADAELAAIQQRRTEI